MNNKLKVWLIVGVGLLVSILFWLMADGYASWTVEAPVILVFLVNYFLNFLNIGILMSFYFWKRWRGVFAGFLITIWWNLVSIPHSIKFNGVMPVDSQLYSASDTLIMRIFPFFQGRVGGVFVVYVVIPFLLLFVSSRILFPNEFVNFVRKQVKGR